MQLVLENLKSQLTKFTEEGIIIYPEINESVNQFNLCFFLSLLIDVSYHIGSVHAKNKCVCYSVEQFGMEVVL